MGTLCEYQECKCGTGGRLAQLVARVLSMHEVAGSIPATSTFASPSPGINPTPNKMLLLSNIFYETFLFDAMRHLEEKFSQKAI